MASANAAANRSSSPSSAAALWGLSSARVIATRPGPEARTRGQDPERLAGRPLRVAGDLLQGHAGQAQPLDLASFEPGRVGPGMGEEHDLAGVEEGGVPGRCRQGRLRALDRQHVAKGHPVQGPVGGGGRGVQVRVEVEPGQGDRADGLLDPGDRPDPDRAVAAQHQGDAVALDQGVGDALGRRLDRLQDGLEVLGVWVGPVGPPGDDRGVPEVVHLEPHPSELVEKSGGPDRRRRLLLADSAGAGS
jgi:hypothetical protein